MSVVLFASLFAAPLLAQTQTDATTADTIAAADITGVADATSTAASDAEKQAAQSTEPAKSGTSLEDAVEANSEAQDYKEDTKPVKAQVVKQEPAVMISSGTGDIDTTG